MDEFNKDPFNEDKPSQPQQQYQQPYQQNYNYNQQNINQQGYIPPQHGGYGYQQYTPYPQQPSQGMAIASLVIGIVSIVFALVTACLPFLQLFRLSALSSEHFTKENISPLVRVCPQQVSLPQSLDLFFLL